jgi:site-specific DNA recombinase
MQAAISARVSTDRRTQDQTIDSQLTALRQWAAAGGHDLRPEHVFADDGYSGTRLDRPALDRLRAAARDGEVDVVGVYAPDRLARQYAYQVLLLEEFQRAGCPVAFVHRPITDDPHDQLLLQIQGAVAEYERAVLRERFRRGKLQKARAGQWVTSKAPFGYRYVPKRDGVPGHLVIDPAEVVRLLFGWLPDDRLTIRRMLKRLAAGPWRPRSGNRHWSSCVVRRIRSDPTYAGTAYANRYTSVVPRKPTGRGPRAGAATGRGAGRPRAEWIAIPVPAIIDESTHEHALAQLARTAALAPRRNTRHTDLPRCLLTCQACGLALSGVTHRGRDGGPAAAYYRCGGKDPVAHGRDRAGPQPSPRADELDAAVWAHVRGLLDDPATRLTQFEAAARPAAGPPDGDRVEVRLRRLDREEGRLLDAYQAGAVELGELKDRRAQIAGRRQALVARRDQRARLRAERDAARQVYDDLAAFGDRIRSRLAAASVGERQKVLQLLVERVIVGADTLEVRHVSPLRPPGPGREPDPSPAEPPGRTGADRPATRGGVNGRTDEPCVRLRSLGVAARAYRFSECQVPQAGPAGELVDRPRKWRCGCR